MASIITTTDNNKKVYQVAIQGGTSATLPTADTYVDKDIIIVAQNSGADEDGTPLVSGNLNIPLNVQEYDVTNYATVTASVPPCIYATDVTFTTEGERVAQFILPSKPRAWFLGLGQSTLNATWNSKYRCVGAQYDGTKIVWHTAYKGNQGSANPYIYRVVNTGVTQNWNEEEKILTITVDTAGSQTYAGPFMQRQYNLYAVIDNFGMDQVLINMIRNENDNMTEEDRAYFANML